MAPTVAGSDFFIQALIKDPTVSYLKVLVQPENTTIDIVAVHGWNVSLPGMKMDAFGVNTWVAEDSDNPEHVNHKTLWLKDFLPDRCPYARVMLFGYNSSVGSKTSTAGVAGAADDLLARLTHKRRDVHDRPILFLCHSLGGIVVKLRFPKHGAVLSIRSYILRYDLLLSSPHLIGEGFLQNLAAGSLRRISGNVRSSIMECLRADSLISPEIHRSFRDCLSDDNIHICSFYEAKPISPLPWLVVEQNSAVLGLEFPKEAQYLVPESNHSSICKFKYKDQNYEVIEDHLDDLVKYSLEEKTSKHEPWMERLSLSKISSRSSVVADNDSETTRRLPSHLNVKDGMQRSSSPLGFNEQTQGNGPRFIRPNVGVSKFTGREPLLELIQQDLIQVNSSQNGLAIHGLGGVGKTQIALKIVEWYQNTCPSDSIYRLRRKCQMQ